MIQDKMIVIVTVIYPDMKQERIAYDIGLKQFEQFLTPLPRDREINPDAAMEAKKMEEGRKQIAEWLQRNLAKAFLELIQRNDTVNGYPKEPKIQPNYSLTRFDYENF